MKKKVKVLWIRKMAISYDCLIKRHSSEMVHYYVCYYFQTLRGNTDNYNCLYFYKFVEKNSQTYLLNLEGILMKASSHLKIQFLSCVLRILILLKYSWLCSWAEEEVLIIQCILCSISSPSLSYMSLWR